jgi:LysM repeat protein
MMNDKFKSDLNDEDEKISQKLNQAAERINVNSQFAAELEERLRSAHRPKAGWFAATFSQVSPVLRWVTLMVLLGLVLSWSIKSLIPTPQPGMDNTSIPAETLPPISMPTETPLPPFDYTVREGDTCGVIAANFGVSIQSIIVQNQLSSQCIVHIGQVLKIPYPTSTPAPNILPEESATPITQEGGYNFRGAKLYLEAQLPESPNQAHVYELKKDEPAIEVEARAIADRFGIQGEMSTTPSLIYGTNDYVFSDGKQLLQLYSDRYFTYTLDMVKNNNNHRGIPNDNAESIIREFLNTRGFDFPFRIFASELFGGYIVQPLAPDSLPMQYEPFTPPVLRVTLDENGQVLSVNANLIDYDPTPLGEYGIVSAQEALQILLDDNRLAGKIEFFNSGGGGGGGGDFYKLNLSGTPVPFPSPTAQPSANRGPIQYIVKEGDTLFAIAEIYGITPEKILEANPWLRDEHALMPGKTLIIPVTASGSGSGQYIVKEGDTLNMIAQTFGITAEELMQINGMTEPALFVGQTLIVPNSHSSEQNLEDLRGFLSIAIHKKADGTESKEYSLVINKDQTTQFYRLEGTNLNELDAYNALPILVSGTARTINHMTTIQVTDYQIPFPDLQFKIVKGTQSSKQIDEQTTVIFTTEDGKSYVEFIASTDMLMNQFTGLQGDTIQQEVLIVPDETFGGMPVIRVYQSSVIDAGAPPMQITANQFDVIDDTEIPEIPNYMPPNLTIDKVELVYFVSNPYYQVNDPNYSQRSPYIQPAWHFHGRYEDGTEFDALIQALKQEFLLPEIVPGIAPG